MEKMTLVLELRQLYGSRSLGTEQGGSCVETLGLHSSKQLLSFKNVAFIFSV